jgi:hypothetical protein
MRHNYSLQARRIVTISKFVDVLKGFNAPGVHGMRDRITNDHCCIATFILIPEVDGYRSSKKVNFCPREQDVVQALRNVQTSSLEV